MIFLDILFISLFCCWKLFAKYYIRQNERRQNYICFCWKNSLNLPDLLPLNPNKPTKIENQVFWNPAKKNSGKNWRPFSFAWRPRIVTVYGSPVSQDLHGLQWRGGGEKRSNDWNVFVLMQKRQLKRGEVGIGESIRRRPCQLECERSIWDHRWINESNILITVT